MKLFLVWDSESETTADCTMLTNTMNVRDESPSKSPVRRHRKRARSPSSDDESEEILV